MRDTTPISLGATMATTMPYLDLSQAPKVPQTYVLPLAPDEKTHGCPSGWVMKNDGKCYPSTTEAYSKLVSTSAQTAASAAAAAARAEAAAKNAMTPTTVPAVTSVYSPNTVPAVTSVYAPNAVHHIVSEQTPTTIPSVPASQVVQATPDKESSNTMLYVAGGVGLLAILGAVFLMKKK